MSTSPAYASRARARAQSPGVLLMSEVADWLGVCHSTIYRAVASGRIPYFRIGTELRFGRQALLEWSERREPWQRRGR